MPRLTMLRLCGKWMTINNYTAFNGGYLLQPLDLFKRLCKNLLSLCLTDEPPSLQTLWQYALRFRVEELFLDSKSGAFEERRLPTAIIGCSPRTVISSRSNCHSICYYSGHGCANCRLASTGRPALAARN
jgi:hypothetical protein